MTIRSGSATTNNSVIVTIPANAQWQGSVTLSGSVSVGANGAASTALPCVKLVGTGAEPPDGSVLAQLALANPSVGLLSLLGVASGHAVTIPNLIILTGSDPVELRLFHSGAQAATATAFGYF